MNFGKQRVLDPVTRDAVLSHLRRSEKIKAIRMYRLSTGAGLLEAKDAVDAIAVQHNIVVAPSAARTAILPSSTVLLFALAVIVGVAIFVARAGH